mmetsp:Transcript_75632/g.231493  ORF Transcript_75632/g.231493 Transcript_75632/m.231493 type:complete len:225 (+) Transcript_75632:990-1664(+)
MPEKTTAAPAICRMLMPWGSSPQPTCRPVASSRTSKNHFRSSGSAGSIAGVAIRMTTKSVGAVRPPGLVISRAWARPVVGSSPMRVHLTISPEVPPLTKQSAEKLNIGGAMSRSSVGAVDLGSTTSSTLTSAMGGASLVGGRLSCRRTLSTRRKPCVRPSLVFSGSWLSGVPGFRNSIVHDVADGSGRFGVSTSSETSYEGFVKPGVVSRIGTVRSWATMMPSM